MKESQFSKDCQALDKKIRNVMDGADTKVGIQVLVVCLARIVVQCCHKEKHTDAVMQIIGNLIEVMTKMSDSFLDEMKAQSAPLEEVLSIMDDENYDKKTRH